MLESVTNLDILDLEINQLDASRGRFLIGKIPGFGLVVDIRGNGAVNNNMAIPTLTSSQNMRPGQSRLQRTASYHEKASAKNAPSNTQILKPPSGTSRGASSPTRLPLYSQNGLSEKRNLVPQREPLSTSRITNAPQSTLRATPTSNNKDATISSPPSIVAVKEEDSAEPTKLAADAPRHQDAVATEQIEPATKSGGICKTPQEQVEATEERATDVRAASGSSQPSTRTLRSQSLRKPAPSAPSMAPKAASHSRHVSSASTIGSTRSSRVSSAETKTSKQAPGEASKDVPGRSSRAPSATQALNRSMSTRAKPDQQRISSLSATREARAPTHPAARRDISDSAPRLARPAFSTLQQHFSPRKTTKAPTSTFTQPPPPSTTPTAPFLETLRLQTELLHLSILHEASLSTTEQYRTSALAALEKHYTSVSTAHTRMRATERDMQSRLNLLALREWTSGSTSFGLSENIQLLSSLLKELPRLTEPDGRVPALVDAFEAWIVRVEQVWAGRDADAEEEDSDAEIEFIDGLGAEWSGENAALTRRLTALAREAEMLMDAKPGSSVAALVGGCKALLRGTLDELIAMTRIEADVVRREKVWVQERLEGIDFAAVV